MKKLVTMKIKLKELIRLLLKKLHQAWICNIFTYYSIIFNLQQKLANFEILTKLFFTYKFIVCC